MVSENIKRILILAASAFLISLFLYTNSGEDFAKAGVIFGGMSLFILLFFFYKGIGKKLVGIDNLRGDILYGLIFGVGLIMANVLGVFNLLLPPVAAFTNIAKIVVVVILAPIVEELIFRGIIFNMLSNTFSFWKAALIQALIFSAFHLLVYSGVPLEQFSTTGLLAVGGSFISAAMFGLAAQIVNRKYNNHIVNILGHAIINFWLVRGTLVII